MFRKMLFSIIVRLGNLCLEECLSIFLIFYWVYSILLVEWYCDFYLLGLFSIYGICYF